MIVKRILITKNQYGTVTKKRPYWLFGIIPLYISKEVNAL